MEDLIHQFGINWKMLAAQVVNFFILMYVLKRFAYQPIINILKERRKKIEEGLHASEESLRKLAETEVTRKATLLKAEEESLGIVSKAERLAEAQSQNMLASAHAKSEHIVAGGQKKLEEDRRKLEEEVNAQAVELIKKGLARTIGKMKPEERDEVLIKDALRELATVK
jgi:F-type H+-transporting ATPase subunit b